MNILSDCNLAMAKVLNAYSKESDIKEYSSQVSDFILEENLHNKILYIMKILGTINNRVVNNEITIEQAKNDFNKLYVECGFENFLEYKFLKTLSDYFFDRKEIRYNKSIDRVNFVKTVYDINKSCPVIEVKNAINMMCLDAIVNEYLIPYALDFSDELINVVDSLTEEEKENAMFPSPLRIVFE